MTDAVAVFPPGFRVLDAVGDPVSGATITFYNAGTTTPKAVYIDQNLTTSLGSVVYCDAGGHPVAGSGSTTKVPVYTGTASYKVVIKTATGVTLATFDNLKGAPVSGTGGGGGSGITQDAADLRYVRNANALTAATSIDPTDIIPIWDTATLSNRGITYANFKTDIVTEMKADGDMFGSGVRALFQQTTAPTGWTKITTYTDHALRLTNGSVTNGGTTAFSTVFASRPLTGTVQGHTLALNEIPSHYHDYQAAINGGGIYSLSGGGSFDLVEIMQTQSVGGTESHAHGLSMTNLNMDVHYVDVILASKN